MDREKFLEILVGFAELKGKALSTQALELYWNAMQGWEIEDFQQAANHLLRTCKFMPLPSDFEDLRKAGRETAGEAWVIARENIVWGLHSFTLDPCCPDQISRVVHMIGGPNVIGMCDENKLTFLERRFTEHYETLQESDDARDSVPSIAYKDSWKPYQPLVSGTFRRIGK